MDNPIPQAQQPTSASGTQQPTGGSFMGLKPFQPPATQTPTVPSLHETTKTSPQGFWEEHPWLGWMKKGGEMLTEHTREFGKELGTAAAVVAGVPKSIGESKVKEQESRLKLSQLLQKPDISVQQKERIKKMLAQPTLIQSAEEQIPELKKTAEQVYGDAAGTLLEGYTASGGGFGTYGKAAATGAAVGATKAMSEGKSAKDVAISSAINAPLGVFGRFLGQATGKIVEKGASGIREALAPALKPVMKKLAPYLTGIPEKEIKIATEQFPDKIANNLKIIEGVTNPADAESALRSSLLTSLRDTYQVAKQNEEQAFDDAITPVIKKYEGQVGSKEGLVGALKQMFKESRAGIESTVKKSGRSYKTEMKVTAPTAEERDVLQNLYDTFKEHDDYSVQGLRDLGSKIWDYVEATEPGTKSHRLAYGMWDETKKELSRLTNGEIDPILSRYSAFKKAAKELAPALKPTARDDTAKNFVTNLEGAAKTGSRDALKELERMAGKEGDTTGEITAYRLAKKLALKHRITGSRVADIMLSALPVLVGGGLGELTGGEKGKKYGEAAGTLIGLKMASPELVSKVLFNLEKEVGTQLPNEARKAIGDVLSNPKTANVLMRSLQSLLGGQGEQPTSAEQQTTGVGQQEQTKKPLRRLSELDMGSLTKQQTSPSALPSFDSSAEDVGSEE